MAVRQNRGSDPTIPYIYGNAVRKTAPATQPVKREEQVRRPAVNHRVRRNREKALQMDLPYVVMLTLAAVCTLCLCVKYLHLQSSIASGIHEIESFETRLQKLRTENNALEMSINTSVDLDYVYQVATGELGMVRARESQILKYDKAESEYVRQNEDIP